MNNNKKKILTCPNFKIQEIWSNHPIIYLKYKNKQTICPYCKKKYKF